MPPKKKLILFDFDGVIADSFSIAFEINKIIDPNIITKSDYQKHFDGNIYDCRKNNTSYGEEEIKRIDEEFFARYIPRMEEVKIFPDMKEVIAKLGKSYILIIISSTIRTHIIDFLKRNNITSYFKEISGSKIVDPNKTERIKMVFEKYGVKPSDCVFITDTLGDMREANSVGVQSIGVSWGFQDKNNLQKGNPVSIAEKPEDICLLVSSYFTQNE
ncbi:MAG: HAD hydrolase-like protein [Candidatus Wildermuthbacteria bacterium]|nr:HAD hydrolase-like protein [Candidatus Wildermuthbacteria bacterium]